MDKDKVVPTVVVYGVISFVTYLVTAGTMVAKAHMFDVLNAIFRATS